jgi:hypothetical protein
MNGKEKYSKLQESLNSYTDDRIKMIYERFHNGRTLIMDDLKYLLEKNPEAFEKLVGSIIRSKGNEDYSLSAIPTGNTEYVKENSNAFVQEGTFVDYASSQEDSSRNSANITEIMASVRSVLESMSDVELRDISRNVYEPLELLKSIALLKQLEDTPIEDRVMNQYVAEKDFDISI